MRIDFCGLAFETPQVTVYLWSPWRAAALEHRLFEAVCQATHIEPERYPDEARLHLQDPRSWRQALQSMVRVLKGWQEDADPALERRSWRWMLEGDSDAHGYDILGEPTSLWSFLRLSLERGGPGPGEDRGEDVDLDGFGLRISGEISKESN
jgi:hypothetical protein